MCVCGGRKERGWWGGSWAGAPLGGELLGSWGGRPAWSRTTVHTYLTRMAAKGLVSMDQSSPRRYAAIPNRETCAARERRDLVDRVYDGSAGQLVAAFVKDGSLSPRSGRSCAACWTRWRCSRVRSLVLPPSDGGGQHGRPLRARAPAHLPGQALPQWQYAVWMVVVLRLILPVGWLGRSAIADLTGLGEALRTWVELGLDSAWSSPWTPSLPLAGIPIPRRADCPLCH